VQHFDTRERLLVIPRSRRRCAARAAALAAALALAPAVLLPSTARAALGDADTSIAADAATLRATLSPPVAHGPYVSQEMRSALGATVREYVSNSGTVFAVAWSGPFKPDMDVLLGRFADRYARSPRTPDSTRSQLRIEQPDLVVHASGGMRFYAGVAYLPQQLPEGINVGDLR